MAQKSHSHDLVEKALELSSCIDWEQFSLPDDHDVIRTRMTQLEEVIVALNIAYYTTATPLVADAQYDILFDQLVRLEERFPDFAHEHSPTRTLRGQRVDGFTKVEHRAPLRSLQNTYSADDIEQWVERVAKTVSKHDVDFEWSSVGGAFVVQPKYDGSAVELVYEYGVFSGASTRWDGLVWEYITQHMMYIPNIPRRVDAWQDIAFVALRGEVLMSKSALERINQQARAQGEPIFANPRNAAAGTLRQLDPSLVQKRGLLCMVYEVLAYDDHSCPPDHPLSLVDRDSDLLTHLTAVWFTPLEEYMVVDQVKEVVDMCQDMSLQQRLDDADLLYDGLVIKVNMLAWRDMLWSTEHHPKWAVAYKYPAQQFVTKVLDVVFQVWRTGQVTPVAVLQPVEMHGSVVSRATLHNFDLLAEMDVRIGDMVWVQKSGEVIPYVIGPVMDARQGDEVVVLPPEHCPRCDTLLRRAKSGIALVCENPACPGRRVGQIVHAVSKHCLNIQWLGDALVEALVERHIITRLDDIFLLPTADVRPQLRALPGIGDKKIAQLSTEIDATKSQPLWRWLHALGIGWVWKKVAQDLAQYVWTVAPADMDNFFACLTDVDRLVTEVYGIGDITAHAVRDFFLDDVSRQIVRSLYAHGVEVFLWSVDSEVIDGPLVGQRIVVTGSFSVTRDDLHAFLRSEGADVAERVTSNVTLVLVWDKPWSKVQDAQKFSISSSPLSDFLSTFDLEETFTSFFSARQVAHRDNNISHPTQMSLFG